MPWDRTADVGYVGLRASAWIVPLAAAALLVAAAVPFLSSPILSDEVFTLEAAGLEWSALWDHLRADVHPPLYYIGIKAWLGLWGQSLAALRAFSLTMAALAAAALALVLPKTALGRNWAGWFLAADGIVLVMSFYGRMYTLLALWCVLEWLASDRRLREGGRVWSVLAAAAAAAGLCTHHFFGLFLAALALWLVLVHGRAAWRLAPEWGTGLVVWAAVWGRAAWEQVTQRPQHLAWVQPMDLTRWLETVGGHVVFAAAALPVGLVVMALRRRGKQDPWPAESRAAALAALAALALPGLISVWKPVWNPRFTIVASPFFAAALAPLGSLTAGAWPVAALGAGAGWLWWPGSQTACTSLEAARQLEAAAAASDTIVFCRLTRKPVEYYGRVGLARRQSFPHEIDSHPGYEGRQAEEKLRAEAQALAAAAPGRVFVVADSSRQAPRILMEALREAGFRQRPPLLECAAAGKHYFNLLAVFDPPLRRTESPSGARPAPESPRRGRAAPAYGQP